MATKPKEVSPEQKALILEYEELVGYAKPLAPFIDAPHGVDAWVRTKMQEIAGVQKVFEWAQGKVTQINCDREILKSVERQLNALYEKHKDGIAENQRKGTEDKTTRTVISDTYERLRRKALKLGVEDKQVKQLWPNLKLTEYGFIVDEQLTQENLDHFIACITPLIEEGERKLKLLTGLPREDGADASDAAAGDPPSGAATDVEDRYANAKCVCGDSINDATYEELQEWNEGHSMCELIEETNQPPTETPSVTNAEQTVETPASHVEPAEVTETSMDSPATNAVVLASSTETEHHCKFVDVADAPEGMVLQRCNECGTTKEIDTSAHLDLPSQDELRQMLLADGIITYNESAESGMSRLMQNFNEGVANWYVSSIRKLQHEVVDTMEQCLYKVARPLRKIEMMNYFLEGLLREFLRDTLPRYERDTKNNKAGDFRRKFQDFDTGRAFLRKQGGWEIKNEGELRKWLGDLVGDLNQYIPADLREDFGVKVELKFSRTKVKARAAAGEHIPGLAYSPEHHDGKVGIGKGGDNSPWTFESVKTAFSKKLALVVIKGEERLNDSNVMDVEARVSED